MNFALNYPEYVSKLVVVDIAPVPYVPDQIRRFTHAMANLDLQSIRSRKEADAALAKEIEVFLFNIFHLN
jgi:hypothetical protein